MYRIDVYLSERVKQKDGTIAINKRKVSQHWYPNESDAKKASNAIYAVKYGTHVFVPREGKAPIAIAYGGYSTSKPIIDNTFK